MTTIRCYVCRRWFPKKAGTCPDCGAEVRPVNVGLMSERWRSTLNESARHAIEET